MLPQLEHQRVKELGITAAEQVVVAFNDVAVLMAGNLDTEGLWQQAQDARPIAVQHLLVLELKVLQEPVLQLHGQHASLAVLRNPLQLMPAPNRCIMGF